MMTISRGVVMGYREAREPGRDRGASSPEEKQRRAAALHIPAAALQTATASTERFASVPLRDCSFAEVVEDGHGAEAARGAHDAAAGMRGGAAHVKILQGRAIARPSGNRAKEEKLLERELTLENIALGAAKDVLNV